MAHLKTLLALYPDIATRRQLLEQALAHLETDLIDMHQAIATGDYQ